MRIKFKKGYPVKNRRRNFEGKYQTFLRDVSLEEGGSEYHQLAQCIRSDQLSAKQVVEHFKDKDFYEYYKKNFYDTLFIDLDDETHEPTTSS
jgi:hypothetical protein